MIAALVAGGAAALAIVALVAWLAHAALERGDRAAAADVARAGLAAQLELERANVATHHLELDRWRRVATTYQEIARDAVDEAAAAVPGHGVDQLRAALGLADALVPAELAAGGDRAGGGGGGLPGGPGPAAEPGDDRGAAGPATVPDAGGPADALR